ncbi:MAG: MFS transporter [Chloroflexota bacterium]
MRRNLSLDVIAAIGVGVSVAMVVSLLPSAARQAGMAPIVLALLAAVPFVANLLSAFGSRVGPRSQRQLALVRVLGAATVLLVAVLPVAPVLVLVGFAFWLSLSLGGPFHVRLWGQIYPPHARGRILGTFGSAKSAAIALAAMGGGILADRIGGFNAIAIVGVVGVLAATSYAGLASSTTPRLPAYTAKSSLNALLRKPTLRRVVTAHTFYGAGITAAVPLFAMVYVDRLGLSMGEIGLIGVIGAVVTTLSYPMWGVMVDRWGSLAALRLGTFLGLSAVVLYAIAPSVVFVWIAAAALGAAGASTDTAIVAIISEESTLEERGAVLAGWNASTGLWGIGAPLAVSLLVGAGIIRVDVALGLAALSAAVGVALYLATAKERAAAVAAVVTDSRVADGIRGLRALALGR